MLKKTGIEATRDIVERHPDARILMCSAVGQEAYLREAISAGAKHAIVKPFRPSAVQEGLRKVLG